MPPVVLVTGCSTGGIGYSLCEEFARQGCKVYATSRKTETIADFDDKSIERLPLDVTSDESVQKCLDRIVEKEGKIDVVVNNAGLIAAGPLVEQSLEDVQKIFDTNAFAILRVCKAVVPIMAKRHFGTIVNIGSIVGEISTPWNGVYCASKAAANSISEVLSMELKPLNISVLHVAPGAVTSNIASNGASRFTLAPNTLYSDFFENIILRINSSQGPHSMPTRAFAHQVVSNALRKESSKVYIARREVWNVCVPQMASERFSSPTDVEEVLTENVNKVLYRSLLSPLSSQLSLCFMTRRFPHTV